MTSKNGQLRHEQLMGFGLVLIAGFLILASCAPRSRSSAGSEAAQSEFIPMFGEMSTVGDFQVTREEQDALIVPLIVLD